ncbi:MAG: hypothetical protein ACRDHW_04005 [Ktedonobacteraceae bacterium]
MQLIHNQKNSQALAVAVTIILEVLFAFLGGWTLYDVFGAWGLIPAIIIGALTGVTLFLLYLYVFIYREYAIDAVRLFSAKRGADPASRLAWAGFLSFACILMDSFFNANRMIGLPITDGLAKLFIWAGLQVMVFVPFALGKMVHAHINVVDVQTSRQGRMIDLVDDQLYKALEQVLPSLNASEMLRLKQGDIQVLEDRLNAIEAERKAIQAPDPVSPLAAALDRWAANQNQPAATTVPFTVAPSPIQSNGASQNGHPRQ